MHLLAGEGRGRQGRNGVGRGERERERDLSLKTGLVAVLGKCLSASLKRSWNVIVAIAGG